MNDEIKDIIRQLRQPHRVPNPVALFKICEKAADIIESLSSKPKTGRPKSTPE
jgi:hypothetical protein